MSKYTRIPERAALIDRKVGTVVAVDDDGQPNPNAGLRASVRLYEVGQQWADAGKRFLLIVVETDPVTRYAFQYSGKNRPEAQRQFDGCAASIAA